MKAHVLQHIPFESIGSIAGWLESRHAEIGYTRFFENPALPKHEGHDLIIVMGGTMSVNDEQKFPWLITEKEWLRQAVKRDIPILGICLGAQLIASALGARVRRNIHKEIGWFPVEAVPGTENTFRFPNRFGSFHWHGETFDLPAGAIRLATNAACENQAFQIGKRIIGLQFHPEFTREILDKLVENFGQNLTPGPYVQSADGLLAMPEENFQEANRLMDKVLDYLNG